MIIKREKYYEISAAKEEVENSLLATEVKTFLATSNKVSSTLYQHCLSAFKTSNYSNFLLSLEQTLESPT
jgi:hypothetical protein